VWNSRWLVERRTKFLKEKIIYPIPNPLLDSKAFIRLTDPNVTLAWFPGARHWTLETFSTSLLTDFATSSTKATFYYTHNHIRHFLWNMSLYLKDVIPVLDKRNLSPISSRLLECLMLRIEWKASKLKRVFFLKNVMMPWHTVGSN
jgi:hypothetical protein